MKKTLFKINKKRLCAFLSAFCMLTSFIPVISSAADDYMECTNVSSILESEEYGIENVAQGKTIKMSTGTELSGLTDGDLSLTNLGGVSQNIIISDEYAIIDLGQEYELAAVGIYGYPGQGAWNRCPMNLYGTNNPDGGVDAAQSLGNITQAGKPDNYQPAIAVSGKYRYVIFKGFAQLNEVFVYAKKYDSYGDWVVRNDAGNKYFEMDYIPAKTAKTFKMITTSYDANGYMTSNQSFENLTTPKLSGHLTPATTDAKFQAVLVSGNDYEVVRPIKYDGFTGYAQENGTATDFANAITYTQGNNSAVIAGKSVASTDYITVRVAKSDTENSETVFAGNPTLYWFGSTASGNGYKFEIPFNVLGLYHICVTRYTADKTVEHKYYSYRYIDDATRNTFIRSIMDDTATVFKPLTLDAVNTHKMITSAELADAGALSDEKYFDFIQYTRDMLYTQAEAQALTQLGDAVNLMNAAAVVNALNNGDTTLVATHGSLLGTNLDTSANVTNLNTVFTQLKGNINSADTLKDVLLWSGMLSYMLGDNDSIANALNTYDTELGIDLSYAEEKDISIEYVARFIKTDNIASLYGQTNFNAEFERAVDEAAEGTDSDEGEEEINNDGVDTGWNPPSGGGGGGGGGSAPSKDKEEEKESEEKTEETPEIVEPQPSITVFSDMHNFGWAGEAVNALVEKNVLNGYENGTFLPEKPVTRAEFIKMLVAATEIEVVEKKDMTFIDVAKNSWYYPYIKIAYTNGICNGVSDYEFNPDGLISRQDMAVLIYNYMEHASIKTSGDAKEFSDADAVSEYAKDAVIGASRAGIINGFEDGSFRPRDNARRVDAAMMISKIMK